MNTKQVLLEVPQTHQSPFGSPNIRDGLDAFLNCSFKLAKVERAKKNTEASKDNSGKQAHSSTYTLHILDMQLTSH